MLIQTDNIIFIEENYFFICWKVATTSS